MNNVQRPAATIFASLLGVLLLLVGPASLAEDRIVSLSVQEKLGYEEVPVVRVELDISKERDLHVAVQTWGDWRAVKRTERRIPKSGKYHFEVPFDSMKPGKYRIAAYISPRRKDWDDRIGGATHAPMEVVDQVSFVVETQFSDIDKVTFVDWPKEISGNEEADLTISYTITEPRELRVKLLSSENWKEFGELTFPVKEPGDTSVPLSNLTSDFPGGKYAWVVFLTKPGDTEPVSEKYGKHFVLLTE